eukprot:4417834-Amphidinium_carterae.1
MRTKSITSMSRKTRGPKEGWIDVRELSKVSDQRMLLRACCYGKKPRIEMRITSNTKPRTYGELDIIILQVRAIQGFFTDNRGEKSMNLDKAAALYNQVAYQLKGRFGYHTTEAPIRDFQKNGIIAGGPALLNMQIRFL